MIFSKEIDRTLFLVLCSDKKNREKIANFIYNLPKSLIEKICVVINNNNLSDKVRSDTITDAFKNDELMSIYRVDVSNDRIKISLSKWYFNGKEEEYNIELCVIPLDIDLSKFILENNDLFYVGSFGSYFSDSLVLGFGPMVVNSNFVGYELYEDVFGNMKMQLSDEKIYEKSINISSLPNEIFLEDLYNKKSVNRLIKRRGVRV